MATEAVAGRVVVDRYQLIETLGTGPMGPVWRAHDRRLSRQVAIREIELPDILDDAEQAALAEKVLREATAAARLDHPAAVTVLDVVTEGDQPFVVSELVNARTLADVVATLGPLAPDQAAALGLRVLDALAAAHALGLVHRDVRPSNVLLTDTGVRLADFGVASMVDDPRITGGAMHEPSFLAPEQTESAGATAQSDLWSLGATLYFAVEGVPPFSGPTPAATIAAIVGDPPRPPVRAGDLRPVLDALLVKDAMDRPDEAALRALLAPVAGDLAPVGSVPPASGANGGAAAGVGSSPWAPQGPPSTDVPTGAGDEVWSPSAPSADQTAAWAPGTVAAQAPPAGAGTSPGDQDVSREPWFFQVPAETVPPPPLPEPPPPPEVEPDRPPGRFPRGLWAALLAALVAAVMIALIVTGGHTLRPQRPAIETSKKGAGDVSTWVPYTDGTTGFTLRYPPEWSVRRSGGQTFFVDPAGVSYLEIDYQQPPAPSLNGSAFDQEKSFSATHTNYKRIGIEETTYQDKPATLWQFSYTEGDTDVRAADLLVNTPKYGFALYFQARAEDWARAQGTFDAYKSVFGLPA